VQEKAPRVGGLLAGISRTELTLLGALTFGHLAVHWYSNLLSLALPFIKEDLNLTDVQVGTIVTVQMGVGSAFIVVSGFLADSFRRRGAVFVSASVVSLGMALFVIGASPSFGWTLVGAGIIGLGTALWHPAAMRSLSMQFPDRRGMALSVHGVGASIGDAVGPIVVGAIIVVADWGLALELHLIPALLIVFPLWRGLGLMREAPGERTNLGEYAASLKAMFANYQAPAVMASNTLIQMARLSVLAFFPIYIKETLGYSAFVLGVYLALLYAMGIVSQPVVGVLSDRVGRKMVLVPSFAAMALLYVAIVVAPAGVWLGLVIGTLGMFFYAILNMTQTAIMDVAPEGVQASTMGVMSLVSLPFTLGSPVLAGYLVTEFGIKSAFWYAAVAAMLAAAILIPVRFRRTI
jgi:MFS family permease